MARGFNFALLRQGTCQNQLHKAIDKARQKQVNWSIYHLPASIQRVVKEDEDLDKVKGFIEGLEMKKEDNPDCI